MAHTKTCLADAMISAVQNLRDDETLTDEEFAAAMRRATVHDMAVSYLNNGLQSCTCPFVDHNWRDPCAYGPDGCEGDVFPISKLVNGGVPTQFICQRHAETYKLAEWKTS